MARCCAAPGLSKFKMGNWQYEFLKDKVTIQIKLLNFVSERRQRSVIAEAERYAIFLKLSPVILFK